MRFDIPVKGDGREMGNRLVAALRITVQLDAVLITSGIDPLRDARQVLALLDRQGAQLLALAALNAGGGAPSADTCAFVRALYTARERAMQLAPFVAQPANAG